MHRTGHLWRSAAVLLLTFAAGCAGQDGASTSESASASTPAGGGAAAADDPIPPTQSPYDALPDAIQQVLDKPFTGDFDDMVKRRLIRVGVTYNRTHYFVDHGQER